MTPGRAGLALRVAGPCLGTLGWEEDTLRRQVEHGFIVTSFQIVHHQKKDMERVFDLLPITAAGTSMWTTVSAAPSNISAAAAKGCDAAAAASYSPLPPSAAGLRPLQPSRSSWQREQRHMDKVSHQGYTAHGTSQRFVASHPQQTVLVNQ
jgi:hypothetical protein